MKKYIKIFSDGSIDFQFNSSFKNKKSQILTKDHRNFVLNKKDKTDGRTRSHQSSKYKNKYLF